MNDKARTRYQEAYRGSAHGKAKRRAWEQSEAGKQSMQLRNQRRRNKLQAIKAADQQQVRDSEIRDKDGKLIGRILPDGTHQAI